MAPSPHGPAASFGLLILRVAASGMLIFGHGWDKLTHFKEKAESFPDPLGLGHEISLGLAVFGEFVCPIAIALGLLTRLASIPAATTMGVAAFVFHAADPFSNKELALLYMVPFVTLIFTGAGRFSIDARLFDRDRV